MKSKLFAVGDDYSEEIEEAIVVICRKLRAKSPEARGIGSLTTSATPIGRQHDFRYPLTYQAPQINLNASRLVDGCSKEHSKGDSLSPTTLPPLTSCCITSATGSRL